jgi:L-cysteine:1D-myo-inositol 2-amino-2-deoxy-alpha-D-glucopyranoside ligase
VVSPKRRSASESRALALGNGAPALPYVERVLAALADDLDAPTAVAAIQEWVEATLGTTGLADTSDPEAAATIHRLLDAALGLSP